MTTKSPRTKTAKLRSKKIRKLSSRRWLLRQLNDPYVHAAKDQGYRSRAAFKLIEIDEAHSILKPGQTAVDLGAAPGGWSQVLVEKLRPKKVNQIVAIDLLQMDPVQHVTFTQLDFTEPEAPELLKQQLDGPADIVVSDIAPVTTGHRQTDHLRILAVVEAALYFAEEILKPGGTFLAKVFQGGTESSLLAHMKEIFTKVQHVKPNASRKESPEIYVLATGFRGKNTYTV